MVLLCILFSFFSCSFISFSMLAYQKFCLSPGVLEALLLVDLFLPHRCCVGIPVHPALYSDFAPASCRPRRLPFCVVCLFRATSVPTFFVPCFAFPSRYRMFQPVQCFFPSFSGFFPIEVPICPLLVVFSVRWLRNTWRGEAGLFSPSFKAFPLFRAHFPSPFP